MAARNREYSVSLQPREGAQTNGNAGRDSETSVQVALRIRPLTNHDQSSIPARWQRSVVQAQSTNAVQVDASGQAPPGATPLAPGSSKRQLFTFDRVLGPDDGQEQVYNDSVMPLISRFMEGYNVTILAYGQTSSGKSYTMGTAVADVDFESLVAGNRPDPQTGIIPRAVAQIFSDIKANQSARGAAIQYTARASFIEIYNEELIDLLADGEGDNRPLVQIREDKAGHIIWSGLKEVRVQSVSDVMNRLLQGSSIRRTNETDMNAQSSRSHAIFSLTLTQRKYVGSGSPPPTSSSQGIRPPSSFGMRSQTPTGRTTPTGNRGSGLPRPGSGFHNPSKMASPTRSNTPGGGSSFGLRPASATSGRASPMPEEGHTRGQGEGGEWVTATSKFHFVDLAGSERLKRTAAQGERVKEGISINAGLHALGNVISALGDPAKSKRTTHVPYRDSKLTRLLQDSLGGNAHTLMIACVSPTEYNVSETVNTLQYANRARNIKNKAEVNQVEIGWDDVDYLQGQVMKLRKEMQLLKGFKAGTPGSDAALRAMNQKEVLEWQAKYASLSQKFSQLTADATRLQEQSSKDNSSQEDYYKAAEPIIIEYEKTVDALEGQINLQKAALGHCEDVIMENESLAREQEEKVSAMERELEGREQTVVGLQARLSKLEDREATANSYARDLESRLAAHTANGEAEASVVMELRRELSSLKATETSTEHYIKELEARLAKAEESASVLHDQVSRLEREIVRRDEAYKDLQQRVELLDSSKENKALLEELDQRDSQLLHLQSKLDMLQNERDEIAREKGRLTDAAAGRQLEKGKLEDRIRELETSKSSTSSTAKSVEAGLLGAGAGAGTALALAPSNTSFKSAQSGSGEEELSFLQTQVEMLSEELKSQREESARMGGEMETVTVKFKEALVEVEALKVQISEARLQAPLTPDKEHLAAGDSPTLSRRGSYIGGANGSGLRNRGKPESLLLDNTPARRKSLSRRSSSSFLGYNPKESTPRDGTTTPTVGQAPGSALPPASAADGSPTLFRTRSLSQSFGEHSSGGRRQLSLSGSADFAKIGFSGSPVAATPPAQTPAVYERKVASLEAETIRLQEVLKERDEEIAMLERERRQAKDVGKENGNEVGGSPSVPFAFPAKRGLADEQTSDMDELMRAMARKETESRQQVEELTTELQRERKEKEASHALLDNQMENMMMEIENLRNRESEMAAEVEKAREGSAEREKSQSMEHASLLESLRLSHAKSVEETQKENEAAKEALMETHSNRLKEALEQAGLEREEKHARSVKEIEGRHATALTALQAEHSTALTGAVEAANQRHIAMLGETEAEAAERGLGEERKRAEEHARQREALVVEHSRALEESQSRLQGEHSAARSALQQRHDDQLASLRSEHEKALEESGRVRSEAAAGHEAALAALRAEHGSELDRLSQGQAKGLETRGEEHASELLARRAEHESALAKLKDEHKVALQGLQSQLEEVEAKHGKALEATRLETADGKRDVERLQQNHLHTLEQLEALKSAHSEQLRALTNEHSSRVMEMEKNLTEAIDTRNALATTHEELQTKHTKLMEQDPHEVDVLRSELTETSDALVTLEGALTETQEERDRLIKELEAATTTAKGGGEARAVSQSHKEVELLQASLANVRSELQRCKSDIQGMLEEKTRQESLLREMQIKVTIAETRSASNRRSSRDGTISPSASEQNLSVDHSIASAGRSPGARRESSDGDGNRSSRSLGVGGGAKPPPLTPPPNMPPPPTPTGNGSTTPTQQQRNSLGVRSSTSSSSLIYNRPDSPNGGTLTRSSSTTSITSPSLNGIAASDPKTAKLLTDQAEELRSLAKQLNHCEMDLQANIDLVATLEAALNDSERNLRKSRVQLSEATRERDRHAMQTDELRSQVTQAQKETDSVRNSVMLEKQGFESKLQMEREAKEKARRALEARLEEVQKKKNGKLFCM